jgi:phosphoglycolate phosphatase
MGAIIFDLDGTIADSFIYVSSFLAHEAGITQLSEAQSQSLRGLSMLAMARQLGHPWWRLGRLFLKGRIVMGESINSIEAFPGMADTIRKLHAEGHELFILSSNNLHNVHRFLNRHKLQTYFLEIYGGVGLFGKAPALRRLIKEHNLILEDCVYVGDELRDVEAAQSIGLRIIAVSWGFAKVADLTAAKPTRIAATPQDIVSILEEL